MFPVSDDNTRVRRVPVVTYSLIALNVLVFLLELSAGDQFIKESAFIPARFSAAPAADAMTLFTAMFMHGGWLHLFSNMLFLWIFGDNIEDRLGSVMYVVFYLICGFAAGYAQVLISPNSQVPLVGASGAIAGVLGGYLVLFPGVKVRALLLFGYFSRLTEISALYVLGFWFILQLFNGVMSLGPDTSEGGVAFFAHVGGFVIGAALIFVFKSIFPQPPTDDMNNMLYQRQGRPY